MTKMPRNIMKGMTIKIKKIRGTLNNSVHCFHKPTGTTVSLRRYDCNMIALRDEAINQMEALIKAKMSEAKNINVINLTEVNA